MTKQVILFLLSMLPFGACGQDTAGIHNLSKIYSFTGEKANVLIDEANSLQPFFVTLGSLQHNTDSAQTVSIVHIGDSHIQADLQTSVTRRLFQHYFGAAGRGFIVPLKLANSNEPRNYRIQSSQPWNNIKCIKTNTPAIGLGGLNLFCTPPANKITITTIDKDNPDIWAFNQIDAFYNTDNSQLTAIDTSLVAHENNGGKYLHTWQLHIPVTSFELLAHSNTNGFTLYGFNLQNGNNGVLYHSIGINGAQYGHYAPLSLFYEQLPLLDAALIIVSLGTNEAYNKNYDSATFYQTIDSTVTHLQQAFPHSVLLLTTPAETWLRYRTKRRAPNTQIALVSKTIVKYATEHHIACWDLFSITGGKGSAKNWQKNNLLAQDGIHFNKNGYEYIGELLFQAIYNSYLKNK